MLIPVYKTKWYTSFDIVRKAKKIFEWQKVGHAGTLDPWAEWVLVLWTWKDTKALWQIQKQDKEYITEVDFSTSTDTWDMQYHSWYKQFEVENSDWKKYLIVNWSRILAPNLEEVKEKLDLLIPKYGLPLPPFSAKKTGWKKFYELARKGEIIEKTQQMTTYQVEVLSYSFPFLKIRLIVGSWNYIRSIWYWLGKQFELSGTLSYLQRTRVGNYNINDCKEIDYLTKL